MLSFRRSAWMLMISAGLAAAQPTLTTIQDVLYRADGTRYNGTIFINWNSFLGGDASNIATASLTLPIVNGVLHVQLVPTTTASAGAQYDVTYNNAGINQFTEVWAVPLSNVPLRVRDVRVSTGSVVGPSPVTSPVQIGDVVGLQNELALRPLEGVGFAVGRAAIINSSGQIDGAAGSPSDCVRVDGSSGPCGSGGGGGLLPSFADGEVPSGSANGVNTVFSLTNSPSPTASLDFIATASDETGSRLHAIGQRGHVRRRVDAAIGRSVAGQLPVRESEQSAGKPDGVAGDLQQRGDGDEFDDDDAVRQLYDTGGADRGRGQDRDPVSIRAYGNGHGVHPGDPFRRDDGVISGGERAGNGDCGENGVRNFLGIANLGFAELGE